MSFSGGVYTLPGPALVTGEVVSATENNQFRNDVAGAFNLTMLRNGTSTATANLPMGGYKLTGLGLATTSGDALSYGNAAVVTTLTSTSLTATRVPYAGTGGLLQDASTFTFDGTTLTAGGFSTSGNISAATATVSGNITVSGGTANGVAYLNGSKVLTTGSSLVFDGNNLGLGVTPSAWGSLKAMQVGNASIGNLSYLTYLNANAYYDGGTWRYISSNRAAQYIQADVHAWYTAPSGTAGNAISFTQAMTLDASGKLNVATGNIEGYDNLTLNAYAFGTNGTVVNINSAGTDGITKFSINNTERMRIDSSGNVGIGTSSPAVPLHVFKGAAGADVAYFLNSGGYGVRVQAQTGGSGTNTMMYVASGESLALGTNNTERMRIDSSGNLLVGTTTANGKLYVESSSTTVIPLRAYVNVATSLSSPVLRLDKYDNNQTTSQVFALFSANQNNAGCGQINANGANQAAFGSFSDARLKTNIVDLHPQLENICALRPVEFDYIESEGGGHQISFIAQELEEVYPDAVGEREDGMKTISGWSKTEARLVKAIQELKAELDATKAEVAALKGN